tara:strand:- start:2925 stop:4385 length:1461 start_codon:yes stop_codon:yes gene_type:complete
MSKKKDWISLGEAYKDVFSKVVVSEDVPAGEVGEAPLEPGGPQERGGFRPSQIDINRMSEKDKKDNIYNIKGYTYGDGNDPGDCDGPDPTGPEFNQVPYSGIVGPEEDEETLSTFDTELLKGVKGYKSTAGRALLERAQREVQKQGYLSHDTRQALAGDIYEEDEERLVVWQEGWLGVAKELGKGAINFFKNKWGRRAAYGTAGYHGAKHLGKKYDAAKEVGKDKVNKALGREPEPGDNAKGSGVGAGPKKSEQEENSEDGEGNIDLGKLAIPAAGAAGYYLGRKKRKKKGENEEDEEILAEHEKIARSGLNNFMSKSVFDKLYNKVMVNEEFDEVEDVSELEALGIETDEVVDEVPEEITVSIPGELAQSLCDILQTALAQQEVEVDVDVDVEEVTDTEFEEDEEAAMKDGGGYGIDAGSTLKHEVNYGRGGKNKVGNLKPTGAAKQKDGGGYGVDAGSTLNHTVNMGKNNKVGKLPVGKNAFEN